MSRAMIICDIQNDFDVDGPIPHENMAEAVKKANRVISKARGRYPIVIVSQWHPNYHMSFASIHKQKPFTDYELPDGSVIKLLPDHCIHGTKGAEFHKDLIIPVDSIIIRCGMNEDSDNYSAFNDSTISTGLNTKLRALGVESLKIIGVGTCVENTIVDANKYEYYIEEE